MLEKAKEKPRRALALLMAIVMAVGLIPAAVFAAEDGSYTVQLTCDGGPVEQEGVQVTLTSTDNSEQTQTAATDADGKAVFTGLEEGSYTPSVTGLVGYEVPEESSITIAEETASYDLVLTAMKRATVTGKVLDENGKGYQGATISCTGYSNEGTVTTGADGSFTLDVYQGQKYTVTVTAAEKYKTYTANVTASSEETKLENIKLNVKTFTITGDVGENGTVSPENPQTVTYGENSEAVQIAANTGYVISSLTVDDVEIQDAKGKNSYEVLAFENVTADHTITVSFERKTYTITGTVNEHGTITYVDGEGKPITVPEGGALKVEAPTDLNSENPTIKVTATPDNGYRVSQASVDQEKPQEFEANDQTWEHTFAEIAENHTFSVTFAPNVYSVTVSSEEGGSSTTDGEANHGEKPVLTIKPNEGYGLAGIEVNDTQQDLSIPDAITENENGTLSFTLPAIQGETTVTVTYDEIQKVDINADQLLENGYYSIAVQDGDTSAEWAEQRDGLFFLKSTAGAQAVISPTDACTSVRFNNGKYSTSQTITETTEIATIYVRKGLLAADQVKLIPQEGLSFMIVKDETAPVIGTINTVNGWSNGDVTISGTVEDADTEEQPSSSLDYVVWSTSELNPELVYSSENQAAIGEDGKFETNEISGQQNQKYYLYAVDKAGNISGSKEVTVQIDETAPTITGFTFEPNEQSALEKVINFLTFGTFFNQKIDVTVTASDTTDDGFVGSGVESITLMSGDTKLGTENAQPLPLEDNTEGEFFATFTLPIDEISGEEVFFNGTVSAYATDIVENKGESVPATKENSNLVNDDGTIMIETVLPEVKIEASEPDYNKPVNENQNQEWYKGDVTFDVSVQDVNSGLSSVQIFINGAQIDKDLNDTDINIPSDEKGKVKEQVRKKTYQISTSQAKIDKDDGSYTVSVVATDNAGNQTTSMKTVYKDTAAPAITGFSFAAEGSSEGDGTPVEMEKTDYGYYFHEDTTVTITAADSATEDSGASGVASITYYTEGIDPDTGTGVNNKITVPTDGEVKFTIPANFKGQIYAKATDQVDNKMDHFVRPDGVIVEDKDQHDATSDIVIDVPETAFRTAGGGALYGADVPAIFTVKDTYSGIRTVEWSVKSMYDQGNNQSGSVTVENDGTFADNNDGWSIEEKDENLVTELSKAITVANNSNDIEITVQLTDRAGNTSSERISFSIDKTAPEISIAYDNNTPDAAYASYYRADRTATVTVRERNFSAADVELAIANTDGVIPQISGWTEHKNTENPDNTYYTATIPYTADGDYTMDLSFTDLAGHSAQLAQQQFTLDKTLPTVAVTYDNNAVLNGNYYAAARTATVTITEHNFDPARVRILGTATDNGAPVAFPALRGWTNHGDVHTATITYTADARYQFDIEFADQAGNSIADYAVEEFYVDQTAPTIVISGVANGSANNGTIAPVITCTDTNFDPDTLAITLTGVNNGAVSYAGAYADVANGRSYTYANFEVTQQVDDIYTLHVALTDRAGNQTEQTITFSANRFGSVYDVSGLKELNGKYLTAEQDIVFTEINVDALNRDDIRIKLTKNGTPMDLVEGRDYTIAVSGGNGQWSRYQYTISRSLFTEDGRYSISVYSVDAAGNVNENIDESKTAQISFGIDKTAPVIVPVDLESGVQYAVETKSASFEIKDNLVLESVKIYLNGQEIQYQVEGETYRFDIPESNTPQEVRIVAVDAAGNEYEFTVDDFLVSTNVFVRWYNNTPLFISSIVGVAAVALAVILLVVFKRRKRSEDQ